MAGVRRARFAHALHHIKNHFHDAAFLRMRDLGMFLPGFETACSHHDHRMDSLNHSVDVEVVEKRKS